MRQAVWFFHAESVRPEMCSSPLFTAATLPSCLSCGSANIDLFYSRGTFPWQMFPQGYNSIVSYSRQTEDNTSLKPDNVLSNFGR